MDTAQIRAILGDAVQEDGTLIRHSLATSAADICYLPGSATACVIGVVTAEELFAIAAHMRAHAPSLDTAPAPAQTITSS